MIETCFSKMDKKEIESEIYSMIHEKLQKQYGEKTDTRITERVQEEWDAALRTDSVLDIAALYEISQWLKAAKEPYWVRGTGGSSFLLYLLGITFGNPLPAHYYCPHCHKIKWSSNYPNNPPTADAFDFDVRDNNVCPDDGTVLEADGHDIPWQTLFGYGDYKPHFDIDVPEHCYRGFAEKLKEYWIFKYTEAKPQPSDKEQPFCYYLSKKITIYFTITKQDIDSRFYEKNITARNWSEPFGGCETAESAECISWEDFLSAAFGKHQNIVPEIPVSVLFSDIIAYGGLVCGTGAWNKKTALLVENFGYPLISMPCFREKIFDYYISHGYSKEDAWLATKKWAKAGKIFPLITEEQLLSPDYWMLNLRLWEIEYLFPKAHIVERTLYILRALKNKVN